MDVKDVSGIEEFSAFFQQLQVTAEQARSRKGQIPHDHPSPGMLVGQFNMERMRAIAMSAMDTGKLNIKTSQVPSAYLPCSRTANELQPLSISKMRLEEHHRGKYVIVRTMTSPRKINVVMTIVEDEEGTAALLQLYNQPEESAVDIDDLLPQHSVCLIKEPFFKVATDGKYSLRVDHVGDFCLLSGNDGLIPSRWRSMPHFVPDSEKIRLRGNTAVGQKKWGRAEKLYTEALAAATTTEQERAALLNRSLANLRLQRPEKALLDAIHAGSNDPPSEKGLFREAKAYYALEQFDLCAGKLQQVLALNPSNKDAEMDLERTGRRIIEQANQAQEDHSHTTCGVWTIASFINHSCLGNCYRSFIGDMMIVRACSDLDAGTELLFSYKLPKEGADYQATQDDLKHWSFICRCGLCEEKKATSKLTFQRRQGLVRDLKKSMRACRTPAHENKVLRLLSQVESTYPGGKETPHLETWEIYLALGQKRTDRRKLTEGLELIIKGLEALGFEIVAFPRGKASGKPTLEIKSWGQVNECLVSAFLSMFHAYKVLAPELCEAAKGYAETVYAITFGEKDTIGTLFKEFK
ncbi:TPR domain protein [Colletotrichum incanum]|nr:TPR domain protein [Colletotrichum incanum]